ncbi:hypothetical protein M3J09_002119 [Ascochyta lentis]
MELIPHSLAHSLVSWDISPLLQAHRVPRNVHDSKSIVRFPRLHKTEDKPFSQSQRSVTSEAFAKRTPAAYAPKRRLRLHMPLLADSLQHQHYVGRLWATPLLLLRLGLPQCPVFLRPRPVTPDRSVLVEAALSEELLEARRCPANTGRIGFTYPLPREQFFTENL